MFSMRFGHWRGDLLPKKVHALEGEWKLVEKHAWRIGIVCIRVLPIALGACPITLGNKEDILENKL